MKFEWLTTTAATGAILAVLGSGVVLAQAQEPQKQHGQVAPRAEQGAAKQPAAQPGRQAEQRPEPRGPSHENAARAEQTQQRPQEQTKQPAQQAQQKATQQAQDRARPQERGKAMSQRPSSLTSEQRRGNEKNAESKAESKADSKTGSKASQRASEQRGKQRNQAAQNSKQQPSQHNTAQDLNKPNQTTTPNRTNAQNAPAKPNANQAKQDQSPSKSQAQQATQSQPSARGANTTTTQTSQNTNQRNTASAKLSQNDRSKVISTLRSDTRSSRESVNVSLSIGERLPPRIHARPLPRTIVDIMPEYRGYDYVMVQDRVDIIDPRTHEVVDIVEESGPTVAQGGTFESGRVRLTTEQRQILFRDARPMTSSQVSSAGGTCLTEQPVPDSVASQNPDLRGFNFLKVGNDIVLIDPKDQKVVDVIHQ